MSWEAFELEIVLGIGTPKSGSISCPQPYMGKLSFVVAVTAIVVFTAMSDNMAMKTFDDIEIRRPEIAKSYLALLTAQPGRPLALFAPRRVGKTFFLDNDLAPAAQQEGMLPVYADLWLHKTAPLETINHALEEALDDVMVPDSRLGKIGKTPVKKIGVFGASMDLGEEPHRRGLPPIPAMRLDALVTRLAKAHGGKILLMLDEVQTLAEAPEGSSLVAAVRAVLHKRRDEILAVFTGSSQEGLARLLNTTGAPMYQFAQMLNFPFLGDEYLQLLAEHFTQVHSGKALALEELRQVFEQIGHKPGLMRDIVKAMSAEGITDVHLGMDHYLNSEQQVAVWSALLNSVDAFDRGVMVILAKGLPPTSRETLNVLSSIPGPKPTLSKVRASIEKLKRQGLLSKTSSGTQIDDPLLAEFLAKHEGRHLE
jgi:hypothetical protein